MGSKLKRGAELILISTGQTVFFHLEDKGVYKVTDIKGAPLGADIWPVSPDDVRAANKARTAIKKVSGKKAQDDKLEEARRQLRAIWFNKWIERQPRICENCGGPLNFRHYPNPRTIIAHIVPKEHFISVEVNDDNFFYACGDCHNIYDGKHGPTTKVEDMPIIPIVKERFKKFMHMLNQEEVRRLPPFLYEVYTQTGAANG